VEFRILFKGDDVIDQIVKSCLPGHNPLRQALAYTSAV
jgi:hypothetical protein